MGRRTCPLYQRSLILTHFTAAIFAASQERVAPRCGHRKRRAGATGDKKRPALRVGHIGPPGALLRLPAIWESGVPPHAARRGPACASRPVGPAGRCAPMKWVNIKEGWYKHLGGVLAEPQDRCR
ncbi:MAG: hypothetical protein V3U34_01845, partial [candidate division NC10 bacterium]